MQRPIGYITAFLLAMIALSACGNDAAPDAPVDDAGGAMVRLSFSVQTMEAPVAQSSRALVTTPDGDNYFEPAADDYEKLRSLRVIIVHDGVDADGNKAAYIEGNYSRNDFTTPVSYVPGNEINPASSLGFEVKGGENKTIYLIANEAATGMDFFTDYKVGDRYNGTIEEMTYAAEGSSVLINNNGSAKQGIPMTEKYEVYVPEAAALPSFVVPATDDRPSQQIHYINLGNLFVTRAAVKFSFNVTASDIDDLLLTSVTVNGLASREYLLPCNTVYSPAKPSFNLFPNATSPSASPEGRFITSYSIPPETTHGAYTFTFADGIRLSSTQTKIQPAIYFCESQLNGPNPPDDGTPYQVSVVLTHQGTGLTQILTAPLKNLPILPRNTHVVVDMTFHGNELNCIVDLVPYIGVYLDPVFGKDN